MLRFAFGLSTAIQPEIILLDEIIGVGDRAFAEKSRQRLKGLIEAASILVLASHDPSIISQICSSAIWMSQGRVVDHGPSAEILDRYAKNVQPA